MSIQPYNQAPSLSLRVYASKVKEKNPSKGGSLIAQVMRSSCFQTGIAIGTTVFSTSLIERKIEQESLKAPLTLFRWVVAIGFACIKRQNLWYEASLASIIFANAMGCYRWWDQIDDQRTLGALPRKKHLKDMIAKVPKTGQKLAVMTVTKIFEVESFGALQHADWEELGIPHIQFEVSDFLAPSQSQMREAAAWSAQQRADGCHLYIHCKAGKGRSACMLAADLIFEQAQKRSDLLLKMNAEEVVDHVIEQITSCRSQVSLTGVQRQAVIDFFKSLMNF